MNSQLSVGVFCGSKPGTLPIYSEAAKAVGTYIGTHGMRLVFGGGNTGLMGDVSQSALLAGAHVTGIMPHLLVGTEAPEHNLSELLFTDSMSRRKEMMMERSDVFLVLPGGVGTLDEAFEVVTDNWLKIFRKPLGFLNVGGYYDALFQFLEHGVESGFIAKACLELCLIDNSLERLLSRLQGTIKPQIPPSKPH